MRCSNCLGEMRDDGGTLTCVSCGTIMDVELDGVAPKRATTEAGAGNGFLRGIAIGVIGGAMIASAAFAAWTLLTDDAPTLDSEQTLEGPIIAMPAALSFAARPMATLEANSLLFGQGSEPVTVLERDDASARLTRIGNDGQSVQTDVNMDGAIPVAVTALRGGIRIAAVDSLGRLTLMDVESGTNAPVRVDIGTASPASRFALFGSVIGFDGPSGETRLAVLGRDGEVAWSTPLPAGRLRDLSISTLGETGALIAGPEGDRFVILDEDGVLAETINLGADDGSRAAALQYGERGGFIVFSDGPDARMDAYSSRGDPFATLPLDQVLAGAVIRTVDRRNDKGYILASLGDRYRLVEVSLERRSDHPVRLASWSVPEGQTLRLVGDRLVMSRDTDDGAAALVVAIDYESLAEIDPQPQWISPGATVQSVEIDASPTASPLVDRNPAEPEPAAPVLSDLPGEQMEEADPDPVPVAEVVSPVGQAETTDAEANTSRESPQPRTLSCTPICAPADLPSVKYPVSLEIELPENISQQDRFQRIVEAARGACAASGGNLLNANVDNCGD